MNQKSYLAILKVGIVFSFLSVFLVYAQFLFPYITSKQIYFNVVTEILLVFWLAFIVKYPQWRPKKSKITLGILAFFGVTLLSCFGSVDFNLSFWGDVERMLGFFHIAHFLILYFVMITVLRDWNDWKIMLGSFIVVTSIVSLTGLYGDNKYGTIGNAAYVGGMIILGFYFALFLMSREKQWYFKAIYLIPIFIMLAEFKKINISGAFVGLGGSIMMILFLFGLLHKNKKVRITLLLLLSITAGTLFFAITHKDNKFVKNIRSIQDLSLQEKTLQTRFISWNGAWKDFGNHWLMGTGYGTFASTFDEYFDPHFYDLTRSGTYFDRAHNNIIDIALTTGLIGLFAYLSIFIFALLIIISAFRKQRINLTEFILLFSLMAAYFVQNLAVFDSLATYIGLMLMFGFIHYISNTDSDTGNSQSLFSEDSKLNNNEIYALFGFGFFILVIIYQYSLAPASMLRSTIYSQAMFSRGNIIGAVEVAKASAKTPLDRDSRSAFIRGFLKHSEALKELTKDERLYALDYLINLAEKNVELDRRDSLNQMRLAQVLNFASRYAGKEDPELFSEYNRRALMAINESIESSPGRIAAHSVKAFIYLTGSDIDNAIDTLEQAINLNPFYEKTYCQVAEIYFSDRQNDNGYEALEKCVEMDGVGNIRNREIIKKTINHYADERNINMMLTMYKQLAALSSKDADVWIRLAKLYFAENKFEEAKDAAMKASTIDESLNSDVDVFIKQVEEKQNNMK